MIKRMFKKIKEFLLTNRTTRQTVAKNTFWLTVSNVGGRLLRAIVIIYAARVLGAEQWGIFSYAITIVAVLTLFIDFGINAILIREAARTPEKQRRLEITSTSFFLKLGLLVIGVAIVLFIVPRFTTLSAAKTIFPIVAAILVFDTLRQFGFSIIQATEKMEREAGLYFLTNLGIVAFGLAFLQFSRTVESFSYAYAIGTGIGMMATFYALRDSFKKVFTYFNPSLIKPILGACWPFAISSLLGMFMINTDILVIGWLKSATDVGIYSAANRIIQLLYIIPSIVAASALPAFARLAVKDPIKMREALERVVSLVFIIALPAAVGGIILGQPIMAGLFGESFSPGTIAFQVLLLTILIDFPAVILSSALVAYDRQKNLIVYAAIGGGLNVLLDFLLIPRFGIAGSSVATLIAQFVSNVYLWHTARSLIQFEVLPHLKIAVFATLGVGILTALFAALHLHFVAIVAIAAIAYLSLLLKLRDPLLRELFLILRRDVSSEPTVRG